MSAVLDLTLAVNRYDHAAWTQNVFGEDLWPHGLEPNRPTLDTFLELAAEQGVNARRLQPEELFAPETLQSFRI